MSGKAKGNYLDFFFQEHGMKNSKINIVNNVNGSNNRVVDVALGSGNNTAASKVVIKRKPHKEKMIRIGT